MLNLRKIILITQYYNEADAMRQAEMELALSKNIQNKHIHSVNLIMNNDVLRVFEGHKVFTRHVIKERATFQDLFRVAERMQRDDTLMQKYHK